MATASSATGQQCALAYLGAVQGLSVLICALGLSCLFYLPPGLGVDVLFVRENPTQPKHSCGCDLLSRNIRGMGDFSLCRDKLGNVWRPK